jgi:prepilin-type N-terminal cleavage/methylation domain-containing protein
MMRRTSNRHQRGFSLIELAIGLVILGLAAVGMVASLSKQADQKRLVDSRAAMFQARDAVFAFLASNGRLPCPATTTSAGQESIASNAGGIIACSVEAGFLPAVTLGLPEVDVGGWFNNAWNDGSNAGGTLPRVFRYAVTSLSGTVANALTSPGLGAPSSATRRSDVQTAINNGQGLFVCTSASGIGAGVNRCGATTNLLGSTAAAIIWTLGANGNDPTSYSADETQNSTVAVARVLISRGYAPAGASAGMFDDLVTWIPYSLVADRLLTAGFVQ